MPLTTPNALRSTLTCLLAAAIALTTMAATERPLEEVSNYDHETGQDYCWWDQQPLEEAPYWSLPQLTGTMKVGSTLAAVAPSGGVHFEVLTYQWLRDDVPVAGATTDTFKLTAADLGKTMGLRVHGESFMREDAGETFTAETPVEAGTLVGAASTITGTARVGATLTARPGTWTPAGVALSYQWYRSGAAVAGAAAPTYKLVAADRGKRITVKTTARRSGYTVAARASRATAPVVTNVLTAARPGIPRHAAVGQTLRAQSGAWSPAGVTLTYQWNRNGVPLRGATAASYKVVPADHGSVLSLRVTGRKAGYLVKAAASNLTFPVTR